MAFSIPDYRKLSPEESSPFGNVLSHAISNYMDLQKGKFARPMLEQELKKAELLNKYYGPHTEANINLLRAQTGASNAGTLKNRLLAELLGRGQGLGASSAEEEGSLNAPSFEGGYHRVGKGYGYDEPSGVNQGNSDYANDGAKDNGSVKSLSEVLEEIKKSDPERYKKLSATLSQEDMNKVVVPSDGERPVPISSQSPMPSKNHQSADIAASLMGIPVTRQVINGNLVTTNPLTGTRVEKVGPTAQEADFTKSDVKAADEMQNQTIGANVLQNTLDQMNGLVGGEIFKEIRTSPYLGNRQLEWYSKFGTAEQQREVGRFLALSGNVIKESAGAFKGPFRAGEQRLLSEMKVNPTDTVEAAKGKLEAWNLLNRMQRQRNYIAYELVRYNKESPQQAIKHADEMIDSNKIRENIRKELNISNAENASVDEIKAELRKRGVIK